MQSLVSEGGNRSTANRLRGRAVECNRACAAVESAIVGPIARDVDRFAGRRRHRCAGINLNIVIETAAGKRACFNIKQTLHSQARKAGDASRVIQIQVVVW